MSVFSSLQCSRSCGFGLQRRKVLCKQRLADGSILEMPESFCPSKSPASQQPCAKQECPPQWVTTDWSQVGFSHAHPLLFKAKTKVNSACIINSLLIYLSYNIIYSVFSDLWKWCSKTADNLQETRGKWGTFDGRP